MSVSTNPSDTLMLVRTFECSKKTVHYQTFIAGPEVSFIVNFIMQTPDKHVLSGVIFFYRKYKKLQTQKTKESFLHIFFDIFSPAMFSISQSFEREYKPFRFSRQTG